MRKEVTAPFFELTTAQAGKLIGISGPAVRRRCEEGKIDAYKTSEGGQWRVKFRPDEVMPREEAAILQKENAELRARLEAAKRVLAG